jgi:hypothetical protein
MREGFDQCEEGNGGENDKFESLKVRMSRVMQVVR